MSDITIVVHVAETDSGEALVGVPVIMDGRSRGSTGTGGTVTIYTAAGAHDIEITPPTDYTCVKCTDAIYRDTGTEHVYLKLQGTSKKCNVGVRVANQEGMQVDATVVIDGQSKRLYTASKVYFELEQGKTYEYSVSADGCDTINDSYAVPYDLGDTLWVLMNCEVAPEYAYITCYVLSIEGDRRAGVKVFCDATNETKETNTSGVVSFRMPDGTPYTITATPPAGHTCECWNCECVQSGVAEKDYDPKLPFRYAVTEAPEPDVWTIYGPSVVDPDESFSITMVNAPVSKDESDYVEIKIDKSLAIDPVIGKGESYVGGDADIACVITDPGTYKIYAYYPGSIIPGGERSKNSLTVVVGDDGADAEIFSLSIPTFAMAGEVKVSGVAPQPNQDIQIMAMRKFIGFDYLAADKELAKVKSDGEGRYEVILNLDEFGIIEVYARLPKDWWDVLKEDIRTPTHTVFIFTPVMLIALLLIAAMVYDKYTHGGLRKILKR